MPRSVGLSPPAGKSCPPLARSAIVNDFGIELSLAILFVLVAKFRSEPSDMLLHALSARMSTSPSQYHIILLRRVPPPAQRVVRK